jgi:hypothetical protein
MIKQNEEYHGIKKRHIKKFVGTHLGHNLTNTEFNDMFNWWNRINKTSPYFMSLGDFLRDTYKMEEIK